MLTDRSFQAMSDTSKKTHEKIKKMLIFIEKRAAHSAPLSIIYIYIFFIFLFCGREGGRPI